MIFEYGGFMTSTVRLTPAVNVIHVSAQLYWRAIFQTIFELFNLAALAREIVVDEYVAGGRRRYGVCGDGI